VPRSTTRDFVAQLRSAGVDDIERGPKISEDVQLVYIADDLRHLISPRSPVEGYVTTTVAAIAARVSGIALRPPPTSSIIVTWFRNDAAISSIYNVSALDLTNDLVAGTIDFTTGPGAARATFNQGTRASSTIGVQLPAGENLPDRHPDLVVTPGQVFLWLGVVVNTAVTFSFTWREVPL